MPSVVLTPLEALLIGGALTLVSGLVVKMVLSGRYISRQECQIQREVLVSHKQDMNIIFAMLRAVIAHMDNITPEKREDLLNMRLTHKE